MKDASALCDPVLSSSDVSEEDRSHLPLSVLIDRLCTEARTERFSIADLIGWFEQRATVALLLIFGILNLLPNPPGASAVLGLPMVYLSVAMILNKPAFFPKTVARRGLTRSMFTTIATRATPVLRRVERVLRPRLAPLSSALAMRFTGLVCLVLSTILVLPVPLGNIGPAACMCLLALATVARDGLWMLIGWALSVLCIVLLSGVTIATIHFLVQLLLRLTS